jgi:hypothetical protein
LSAGRIWLPCGASLLERAVPRVAICLANVVPSFLLLINNYNFARWCCDWHDPERKSRTALCRVATSAVYWENHNRRRISAIHSARTRYASVQFEGPHHLCFAPEPIRIFLVLRLSVETWSITFHVPIPNDLQYRSSGTGVCSALLSAFVLAPKPGIGHGHE